MIALLWALGWSCAGPRPDALPPGALPRPPEVARALAAHAGGGRYTNRLALEASPYLRQHAHQPVDWYPWGDEAFEVAARTGRPVLLSIGYATCHWCHVMSAESFEDPEIARFLNEHFVAVKVDREEHPDVDAVYLEAVEGLLRRPVGWPLTVFLTPDGAPFHGDTYRPARDGERGVATGFLTLIQRVAAAWEEDPARFRADAAQVRQVLARVVAEPSPGDLPGAAVLEAAVARIAERWDEVHGGPARPPKFPNALPLRFLLREHQRTGDPLPLRIATVTLDAMARGGIRDQIGGGFHRYAVDAAWRVPHFEKTLYDNAQLAGVYTEAWRVTGAPAYAEVARSTLRWLDRRMSAPDGAFVSALDAGAAVPGAPERKEEGRPYTWTPAEVRAALPDDLAALALVVWDIREDGDVGGRAVPARVEGAPAPDPLALDAARSALLAARDLRPQPAVDDKVVTAWNGLAIGAFARASVAFAEPAWAARAARAADAVWARAWRDGGLRRIARDGDAPAGVLEDHVFLAAGLVDLFEATADPRWFERALLLDAAVRDRFTGPDGGLWRTPERPGSRLPRERPDADGPAEPSGTSVHVRTLYRLAALTGDDRFRARADAAMRTVAGRIRSGHLPEMLLAVDWRLDRPREIVVVVPAGGDPAPLLAVLRERGPRNRVQVVVPEDEVGEVGRVAPIVAGKVAVGGAATAYVCEHGLCRAPATTPEALRAALEDPTRPAGPLTSPQSDQ